MNCWFCKILFIDQLCKISDRLSENKKKKNYSDFLLILILIFPSENTFFFFKVLKVKPKPVWSLKAVWALFWSCTTYTYSHRLQLGLGSLWCLRLAVAVEFEGGLRQVHLVHHQNPIMIAYLIHFKAWFPSSTLLKLLYVLSPMVYVSFVISSSYSSFLELLQFFLRALMAC